MATLTGQPINTSYSGLIKTSDNGTAGTSGLKQLSDGEGNLIPMEVSQEKIVIANGNICESTGASSIVADPVNQEMAYLGNHNFTAATVTGIGGGGGGLVPGTGTSSMKSADDLTPNDALAGGSNAIAIGEGANANQDFSLSVGTFSQAGIFSTAVGTYSESSGLYCSAFGPSSKATGDGAVSVGQSSQGLGAGSVSIGRQSVATLEGQIAIGDGAQCGEYVANAIGIGNNVIAGGGTVVGNGAQGFNAGRSAAYGAGAKSLQNESVAIGGDAIVNASGGVALGDSATVATGADNAVAIGNDVTASTANTVTIKKLQMLDYATLNYVSDAAAATGGIPLGGVYHTDGALKIRIA